MTATMQKVKGETITDHTKIGFISPLDLYIENNCKHCHNYQGLCRPNDSRGLTPMLLCITLSVSQPPNLEEMFQKAAQTQKIAEKTLQEAEIE
jgi:hypothetical protein